MTPTMRSALAVGLVAVVAGGLTLFVQESSPTAKRHDDRIVVLDGSRVDGFADLSSLARSSSAVLEVEPTDIHRVVPADKAGQSDVMSTLSTLQVKRIIRGRIDGTQIVLRELGDLMNSTTDMSPRLETGVSYIVFVVPFTFADGKSTGQYVLTDGSTAYRQDAAIMTLVAGDSETLPTTVSRTQLEAQVVGP
jgi:hypothetical protein